MPELLILALGAALIGGATQDLSPPVGPHRLAYTFTSRTEVAFMDLASLRRTGSVIEGWSLNIFREPYQPDHAPAPSSMHWVAFRIDCGAQTARFVQDVGIVDGEVAFSVPILAADGPVRDGWVLDEAYACQGASPARPLVLSVPEAVDQAGVIMSSDAWGGDG